MNVSVNDKILMIMSRAKLGDFLLLTPHLQALKLIYPNLFVQMPPMLAELYDECGLFNASESNLNGEFKHTINLSYPLLQDFELPKSQIGLEAEFFRKPQHVFISYGEALQKIFPAYRNFSLKPQAFMERDFHFDVLNKYNLKQFRYFTIHSGSDYVPKNWAPKNFEKTVLALLRKNPHLQCISFVGPRDEELFTEITPPPNFRILKISLREVAHVLSGSLFHIDNDSGVHHLAGVLNVPSISVFGPTGPGTWASAAQMNFIHWGGACCAEHCGGARSAECKEKICLNSVKPESVVESADTILSYYSGLH
ncbi:MAG: glycosyltransferase family 9 protein [Pseudobdellovibrio sp.]